MLVAGTRPEAIKLSPVARSLRLRGLDPQVVLTGQHPHLDLADYGFGHGPHVELECPGQADPIAHVGAVAAALRPLLEQAQPELVIVQGDTSSAFGAARAAGAARIAVAHVEAGLRSHDRRQPWPEEDFRIAIDSGSAILFAPTELSAANLRRERIGGQIHVTGNTGIDAVLRASNGIERRAPAEPTLLVTCHRRENWGTGVAHVADALRLVAEQRIARVELILHPNPDLATRVRAALAGCAGISFHPPCGHADAIRAMLSASLVLSDSGGMQEEAAVLGVPLLILRGRTERPEAIATGNVELIGTDSGQIVAAVRRSLAAGPPRPAMPFGDGRAGDRIAAIVDHWLANRAAPHAAAVAAE
ncbi:non-hydrolyzing UDP-N-acetylglucosamine 2-epimerase [Sphingomonas sabuli]|nr:UDP-N-acetylglucosamine 2-epimerase (non-hydrolyzing) [Sphingomonas sabuli]